MAIGITFAGVVLANSLGNVTNSKNRVIATSIAREGIEAVRNIRDTNWLKFSGNRRECWNHLPQTYPDVCDGSDLIIPDDYIVYKDESQRWRLKSLNIAFDSAALFWVDIDANQDTDGDRNKENDLDIFNHRLTRDNSPVGHGDDPIGRLFSRPTAFKRVISIDYLDNAGESLPFADHGLDASYNRMVVSSTVTWLQNGVKFSVLLTTHLTDYFGRDNLES